MHINQAINNLAVAVDSCDLRFAVFLEDQDDDRLRTRKPGNSPDCRRDQAISIHLCLVRLRADSKCNYPRLHLEK